MHPEPRAPTGYHQSVTAPHGRELAAVVAARKLAHRCYHTLRGLDPELLSSSHEVWALETLIPPPARAPAPLTPPRASSAQPPSAPETPRPGQLPAPEPPAP